MTVFTLDELRDTISLFSATEADFWSENSIVALEHNNHQSGCILKVEGDQVSQFELRWTKKVIKNGYKEEKKFIEKSAEAVSFFLTRHFTDFNIIQEAIIGTGFDYWLGYDDKHQKYDPKNFFCARLEISGINTETSSNTIERRVKIKQTQTVPSDNTALPAYISVVEHSTPKAHFSKK